MGCMKRRYVYAVLFGLPGLLVSALLTLLVLGMTMGVLWLFVFGDNTWPAYTDTLLPVFFLLVFLLGWVAFLAAGYLIGKRREADAALNKTHVLLSLGATAALLLLVAGMLLYR